LVVYIDVIEIVVKWETKDGGHIPEVEVEKQLRDKIATELQRLLALVRGTGRR